MNDTDNRPSTTSSIADSTTTASGVNIANETIEKECIIIDTQQGQTYCELYGKENITDEVLTISNIIVIVHGLGGTVTQWEESGIAPFLARNQKVVICFDWYSHGKSTKLNANEVQHNVELFITQLHDVVNHVDLPIRGKQFHLHGFSMGKYMLLYIYFIIKITFNELNNNIFYIIL